MIKVKTRAKLSAMNLISVVQVILHATGLRDTENTRGKERDCQKSQKRVCRLFFFIVFILNSDAEWLCNGKIGSLYVVANNI